ncbi:phosphoketolase family protein [Candidatus Woesearchaeota archaeon]|nr:phosphoketolase family protein [Candidatus Woesearchaeota archaeon]MBT4387456.1 phosphoketolase family protein [Candidatus Woesearchaeota archaeon]MBT4595833.1 phosphoketolase family protein [Candidatus Woesearchaeota archaeon]MBT5741318.1 phosphoketolase family protein [Candidatus Woesearchaeota archaeon]MBT6505596.1 phosphoketolase family protein [Candidatus Woesearchaeota archaeon]
MKQSISNWIKEYCRLTDYISIAQIYLKDNVLLNKPLLKSHIKSRIVGHWGTCPGINYIYGSMNAIICKNDLNVLSVIGPGHGYPAVQANLFVEGSLGEFDNNYKINKKGFENLIKHFSWPYRFPSHVNPKTPGAILEGGELGYSLSTSFGSILDNPKLITMCIVGDGEAETGPLSAAWQSIKFINPKKDGAVLPIVHINGYKISNPTLFSSMSNDELKNYFSGLHYDPIIVEPEEKDESLFNAINSALIQIKQIQKTYSDGDKPKWPVLLLRTPKGWGGIKELNKIPVENSYKSHGVPINPNNSSQEFNALKLWLKSYKIEQLIKNNKIQSNISTYIPKNNYRMGMNTNANPSYKKLILPDLKKHIAVKKNHKYSSLKISAKFISDIFEKNKNNFRLFCPDELESNLLGDVLKKTKRVFVWPIDKKVNKNTSNDGRIMEILSEHTLQGWINGYVLTGRHGIFSSYEAFIEIVSSMADQFVKFLKLSSEVKFRKPIPSLNYLLTSLGWRQDHNGFSHQNPSFISNMIQRHLDFVNVYFPSCPSMTAYYLKKSLESKNKVNIIVAGKRDLIQFLSDDTVEEQVKNGALIWDEYSSKNYDIVLSSAGDYSTQEVIAAIKLLNKEIKELKIRYINVSDLKFLKSKKLNSYFGSTNPIIFNFHGYPELIKALIDDNNILSRININGYIEEGTTTTPFDMQVRNKTSRYHIAIQALELVNTINNSKKSKLILKYKKVLDEHKKYIIKYGCDMPNLDQ